MEDPIKEVSRVRKHPNLIPNRYRFIRKMHNILTSAGKSYHYFVNADVRRGLPKRRRGVLDVITPAFNFFKYRRDGLLSIPRTKTAVNIKEPVPYHVSRDRVRCRRYRCIPVFIHRRERAIRHLDQYTEEQVNLLFTRRPPRLLSPFVNKNYPFFVHRAWAEKSKNIEKVRW
jgi:hypothetical protein